MMINTERFSSTLLDWSNDNQRYLPWKNTLDPYKIWISEIILQQTRVNQGTPYYLKFIETFPTIQSLANANEENVLKLWQGLGYYSRARNLHYTAIYIVGQFNGEFPNSYAQVLKLKGIGPYTAAAIVSFAFGLRHPVVDGNVNRLLSRILGIEELISSKEAVNKINTFLHEAIKYVNAATFNQAIMDFGSSVCLPKNPKCETCCFQNYCKAKAENKVSILPNKLKANPKTTRYFHYIEFILPRDKTILQQRTKSDIWKNLFQFPLIELLEGEIINHSDISLLLSQITPNEVPNDFHIIKVADAKQILTHRYIYGSFYKINLQTAINKINQDYYLVERKKVTNFAVPRIVANYIQNFE